jgi:hypothetical protein
MQFQTTTSSLSSVIKAGFNGAFALVILAACSDSLSVPVQPSSAEVYVVETQVSDAEKNPVLDASSALRAPGTMAAMLVGPSGPSQTLLAAPVGYSVVSVTHDPEPAPTASFGPNCADCVMMRVPLGFDFMYYGAVYSQLNISSNGFVGFGATLGNGCCRGGAVPSPDVTNNIIALAWSDWEPQLTPGGSVRYETRGSAPNRRFVLQFTNVKEFGSGTFGRLTSQLVLHEESNEITIHTTSMSTTRSDHIVTQAIENAPGTAGQFVAGRVRNFYKLDKDAVKFIPTPNARPVLTLPSDISIVLEIGSCEASVNPGSPSATDDTDGFTILPPVRSDGRAIDAPYRAGVTTIAWTVLDIGGLKTTADQTIHVKDQENPSITAPASISAENDPGKGSAVLVAGNAVAADNCGEPPVSSARSDGAQLSAPFPVGTTTITWTAKDAAGNSVSASQSVLVRDVEAPRISASDIELDATSKSGVVVSAFNLVFGDNVGVVNVSCTPEPGSMFRAGTNPVTCTAVDAAGLSASATFNVIVHGAAEQIVALLGYMETLDLTNGAGNPLMNQLRAALAAVEQEGNVSCKKVDDFLRMLTDRKKSSDVSYAEMFEIIEDAKRIKAVLGCQ